MLKSEERQAKRANEYDGLPVATSGVPQERVEEQVVGQQRRADEQDERGPVGDADIADGENRYGPSSLFW